MTLEVAPDGIQSVRVPPQEMEARLRLELAAALYSQNPLVASGKACALAGLKRWDWQELLAKHRIPRHYAEADLAEDLNHAQGHQ